ncbi:BLUF domain-containing protein [Mongoliimonas terrestris]|uniref:BLUF domain-containing protein n=1 Tax=Mongoliimonas terrestris TaxID=1709001 RepID=UPI0009F9197D|nr:BLUF domain-containing protein [Mongoliimonas terrestris]
MKDDSRLFRLIYASTPSIAFGTTDQLVGEMIFASSLNNARVGITGLLVADDSFYLQLLEGDRQAVTDTFLRIAQDCRHSGIQLLDASDQRDRLFPNWAMSMLGASESRSRLLARHRKSAMFIPHELSATEAAQFFIDVSVTACTYQDLCPRTVIYID